MESSKFKVGDKVKYTWEHGVDVGRITRIVDENMIEITCTDEYSDRIFIASPSYLELYSQQSECSHKWIDIGFNFTKEVCCYCDKEK